MKVVVAPERSFAPGTRRIVHVGGRSIGVFHLGDRFYAVRNRCPHQGGPLCLGRVHQPAESQRPGDPSLRERPPMIACPWHGWEYDLETGQSFMGDSAPGVRSYDVQLVPGPYLAETFDVFVEDEYVVLET
jgi:3-phenylpropionate/trans-cinnamate dioxygenase ferredoxin subunit